MSTENPQLSTTIGLHNDQHIYIVLGKQSIKTHYVLWRIT